MIEITSFFNLTMVWNHGVSFGMFSSHQQPLLLSAVAALIVIVLLIWLAKSHDRYLTWGIGLIVGGAIGNIIDRLRFGAVVDFLDFHAFGYHWPAFNIADSAIFIGVVVLCIQSMMQPSKSKS
jgi:signal peptidase II